MIEQTLGLFVFKVESFDLSILALDLSLKLSDLVHQFLFVEIGLLHFIVVLNEGQRHLGCLVLMLLFGQRNQILQLLMFPFVLYFELVQSVLVLFPEIQVGLNFLSQSISCILKQLPKNISFSLVSSKPILQVTSQRINVGLIELTDLNLHQLDFPFIVHNQVFDLFLKFTIIPFDVIQSLLLVLFDRGIQVQKSLDLLLFGLNDLIETANLSVIELDYVILPCGVVPPNLVYLVFVELS